MFGFSTVVPEPRSNVGASEATRDRGGSGGGKCANEVPLKLAPKLSLPLLLLLLLPVLG